MKQWKVYISLKADSSRFYDIFDIEVTDDEYRILSDCVADKKPLEELSIYKDLVERAVNIEKDTLREILLDDPEEDLDLFSEEENAQIIEKTSNDIEFGNYETFLDDPNVNEHFRKHFITGREYHLRARYPGLENRVIPFEITLFNALKTKAKVTFTFDENGVISDVSDITTKEGTHIINIFMENEYYVYPDYKLLIPVIERMLYRQKDYDGDLGIAKFPGYDPEKDEDPYDIELERRYRRLRGEPDLSVLPEKKEESEKPVEAVKPKRSEQTDFPVKPLKPVTEKTETAAVSKSEPKTVVKEEPKKSTPFKFIPLVLVAIIATLGIYVYNACFVPKSPVLFDTSKLASYEVDGYYDVFDRVYKDSTNIERLLENLDRFKYVKVLNPFEKGKDGGDRVGVTVYDENGKKLEEIIIYSDERISINGSLCKPVELRADTFFLPSYLKEDGKQFIEDTLRPSIERMKSNAEVDGDNLIIELIDIPFDGGTYSKIWGGRTDSKTGKEKRKSVFSKTAQNYEHLPGYKMKIDFKANLGEEKMYYMWLDIEACGVTVSYNLTDIIPEQYKAEKPAD